MSEPISFIKCSGCREVINVQASKCLNCGKRQKKKFPLLSWLIVILVLLWFIVLNYDITGSDSNNAAKPSQRFEEAGYFKDTSKNRIFTIKFQPSLSEAEIKDYAKNLMSTSGQMMAAYFYQAGSIIPADGITLAGSIFKANATLYERPGLSKWQYAYILNFNGTSSFVNCMQQKDSDLCRK